MSKRFVINYFIVVQSRAFELDQFIVYFQAETREDEQQKVKYQEIIDLLIGAGYYRAKIKALSEFDKVKHCFLLVVIGSNHSYMY